VKPHILLLSKTGKARTEREIHVGMAGYGGIANNHMRDPWAWT